MYLTKPQHIACTCINCKSFLHSLGAWQFLADMPFHSVSSGTLWSLFWALHTDLRKAMPQLTVTRRRDAKETDWRTRLQGEKFTTLYRGFSHRRLS